MKPIVMALIFLAVAALVAGQVFLKHAANLWDQKAPRRRGAAAMFVAGIGAMTLWFFLWLGLLQRLDLSYLYPFEALSAVFVCLAGSIVFREKMSLRLWTGLLLITLGILLVSGS